jgi:two-component system, LytTR family, response regulator
MTEQIRAVIVDDEHNARDAMRLMLTERPEIRVVAEASNGVEAEDVVRRLVPDLLFLDVRMPDRDGFALLEALGAQVPRGIIFVTAHDEHAVRAFEVHALDYVLKPFGRQRFDAAVTRALDRLRALDALTLQRALSSMAQDRAHDRAADQPPADVTIASDDVATGAPRRLAVRVGAKLMLVDVASVDWVESDGDYARIHTGKTSHLVAQRMHVLQRLFEPVGFVRIHRSIIVNGSRIHELHRDGDGSGTIVLHEGVRLRVARDRWEALRKALRLQEL